jgi:catechol 2,3-dioxygenase-like lactoylglutathione lyase family enzyme
MNGSTVKIGSGIFRRYESRVALPTRMGRKVIGFGIRSFFAWNRLVYRVGLPWGHKLRGIDHITFPCDDLAMAERFYVGLLGARVVLRIDKELLTRMGWSLEDIERNRAVNLSLTIGSGPRLDLFEYPMGKQPEHTLHPHVAIMVAPSDLLVWKKRLVDRGVIVAGPTRAGPPGQASFYFNDPFGNHLEMVTVGFTAAELPVGMPDRSRLNYTWRGA